MPVCKLKSLFERSPRSCISATGPHPRGWSLRAALRLTAPLGKGPDSRRISAIRAEGQSLPRAIFRQALQISSASGGR